MLARVVTLCLTLLALGSAPYLPYANAQSSSGETNAYKNAIANALQEFELGNYAEAREQFRVAHEITPSARTLRGLGITEFELRNYPESVMFLEQALASDTKPLSGEMRSQAEAVLDRARGYVGEVTIELTPGDAEVTVNGQPSALSEEALLLAVGDHILEFRATGYATQRRGITVKGRQKQTLTVDLAVLPSTERADASPISGERPPEATPVYKRWWLWTTIGAVAVAGGVTAALLVRRAREPDYEYRPGLSEAVPDDLRGGLTVPARSR